jgi:hypothetical protein
MNSSNVWNTCRLVDHVIVAHYLPRAKVPQLDSAALGKQQIFRLDVPGVQTGQNAAWPRGNREKTRENNALYTTYILWC